MEPPCSVYFWLPKEDRVPLHSVPSTPFPPLRSSFLLCPMRLCSQNLIREFFLHISKTAHKWTLDTKKCFWSGSKKVYSPNEYPCIVFCTKFGNKKGTVNVSPYWGALKKISKVSLQEQELQKSKSWRKTGLKSLGSTPGEWQVVETDNEAFLSLPGLWALQKQNTELKGPLALTQQDNFLFLSLYFLFWKFHL